MAFLNFENSRKNPIDKRMKSCYYMRADVDETFSSRPARLFGAIAQLVARYIRIVEVRG